MKTRSVYFVLSPLLLISSVLFLSDSLSCEKKSSNLPAGPDSAVNAPVSISTKGALSSFLKESSGLCYTDGGLWSFGDSGNPPWLLKVDTVTGATVQTIEISNYSNTDWEDITADSAYIYIGDFGNNNGNRNDLRILRVNKSDIAGSAPVISANAEAINFSYADQTDFTANGITNYDCESVVSVGDSLYLFTKDRGDFHTRCYVLSKQPGSYNISPRGIFNTIGKVTAAAYNPVTHELALLGYQDQKLNSFIWFFDGFGDTDFFGGTSQQVVIGKSNLQWQTEGLDYISPDRLLMSCETTPGTPASLYAVQKK